MCNYALKCLFFERAILKCIFWRALTLWNVFFEGAILKSTYVLKCFFWGSNLFKLYGCWLLHYWHHCSYFISYLSVHASLIMFHFYFLQSTVHLIHFTYHSPSRSCLPYLVVFILHGHSTSLSVSLSSQSRLWKLTTYECL